MEDLPDVSWPVIAPFLDFGELIKLRAVSTGWKARAHRILKERRVEIPSDITIEFETDEKVTISFQEVGTNEIPDLEGLIEQAFGGRLPDFVSKEDFDTHYAPRLRSRGEVSDTHFGMLVHGVGEEGVYRVEDEDALDWSRKVEYVAQLSTITALEKASTLVNSWKSELQEKLSNFPSKELISAVKRKMDCIALTKKHLFGLLLTAERGTSSFSSIEINDLRDSPGFYHDHEQSWSTFYLPLVRIQTHWDLDDHR